MSRATSAEEVARLIEDRATPKTDRAAGDPFAEGLSDQERAARLEGRKLLVSWHGSGLMGETMFRVDLFRRYLAQDDGGDGKQCVKREQDLIQFYGLRANRRGAKGEWAVDSRVRLHTVPIGTPKSRLGVKVKK